MAELRRFMRIAALAAVLVLTAAGCGTATPASPPPAAAPAPISVYTLAEPLHRTPFAIDWDAASGSFFVGSYDDGTIYRGHLDDPNVPVFLLGQPGQTAAGVRIAGGRLYVAGGIYGDIRVYDLATHALVGRFETGPGGEVGNLVVTGAGDVWVFDAVRPVLWHLTPEQLAAGSGTPTALSLAPEIPFRPGCANVGGIALMTDQRLLVDNPNDGTLYRIDLDPAAANSRTVTPIAGAAVRQSYGMVLDGHRLVVADFHGLSIVELSDDASRGTVVGQSREPSFRETRAVAHAGDRYLVVNSKAQKGQSYTVVSVPAAG